jgi:hypothetical protein
VLEELRWNPRALAGRTGGRRPGADVDADGGEESPSLSTSFAEGRRGASTGAQTGIHRPAGTRNQGGVV